MEVYSVQQDKTRRKRRNSEYSGTQDESKNSDF